MTLPETSLTRYGLSLAWLTCLALWAQPAQALVETAVQLESSWASDSNPLRLPQGADLPALINRNSARSNVLAADVRAAIIAPLMSDDTRLEITGSEGRRSYQQLPELDHQVQHLDSRLVWRLDRLWRGQFQYTNDTDLYQPQNEVLTSRDMVRQQQTGSELALRVSEELELPLTLSRLTVRHDNPQNQFLDLDQDSAQVAARYVSPLGSTAVAGLRVATSDYPYRSASDAASLDTRYVDHQGFVDVDWAYSPLTHLRARLATLSRSYQNLGQSNFSRPLGGLGLSYEPSVKTRLEAGWSRQVYDSSSPGVLYYLSDAFQASLLWRWSDLTRLRLQASHARQQNTPAFGAGAVPVLPDNVVNHLGASVDYALTRGWTLYAEGSRDRFGTVGGGPAIDQNVLRVGLQYNYESVPGATVRGRLNNRP